MTPPTSRSSADSHVQPILVIVSVDPEASHRTNEAIRIALGILAGENPVEIALVGAAAKVLDGALEDYVDGEDILKHLSTLKRLGQAFHVDREAIPATPTADWNPLGLSVLPLDSTSLADLTTRSRRVLAF